MTHVNFYSSYERENKVFIIIIIIIIIIKCIKVHNAYVKLASSI